MLNQGQKNEPIYKHTHLDPRMVARVTPLMESTFAGELANYGGNREAIKQNKIKFAAEQYANRLRIAENLGGGASVNPLFEDAKIFGEIGGGQLKNLFESVTTPGNIVGMGEVTNPQASNSISGGMWNPGYKAGSGDIPSYVFGLQSHLAYHCIGFDLIPTISVDTPKIVLNYVDTVYGGGTFDDAENMPSYVEISSDIFTAAWVKDSTLKRATSELILRVEDGVGKDAIKVRFMLKSTVKAALTVEVLSTGTVAADHTYTETNTKSVKAVLDLLNASLTPKVVVVTGLVATALTGLTKVDYASATRTNISEAASNNNSLGGMSRAQHSKGPKHKLNIISMDKQIEVKGIEIEADTDNIQIKDMAAMGINVIARLYNGVQNQLVQTLDEVILNHLYALGVQHAVNTVKSQGINHSLYIDAPANTTLSFSSLDVTWNDMTGTDQKAAMGTIANSMVSTTFENQTTHADRLYARILLTAEFIAYQNRIAPPDFIVLGGTLASCLKKNATYSVVPTANTLSSAPELHYSGTIFDVLNVYKNPKIEFNDPRILLGRRGDDTDPGAKFIAYDLAASRQTIVSNTMAEKIRVWSRFEIADIGFYPELNYYTLVAINKFGWA